MSKKTRRQISSKEKVHLLKRHLLERVPISDLCEEAGVHPSQFYQWQKQFFENGEAAFEKKGKKQSNNTDRKLVKLEEKLSYKDGVIAELLEDHMKLKKKLGVI